MNTSSQCCWQRFEPLNTVLTCQSFIIHHCHRHTASLYCLMQFCTAVRFHVKLHLVLPQAGTESLRRISVGFWCITTSRDGEEKIQTGRGFLALLSALTGSPTTEASPPCSQWRNIAAPHYITLAEAPKGDRHSHVPDMTNSSSEDKVMEGGSYSFIPALNLFLLPSGTN